MLPRPVKPIPIWIGASSEAVLTRAVKLAEGWHGSRLSPEEAAPIVRRIREQRPGAGFAISLRYGWDGKDEGALHAPVWPPMAQRASSMFWSSPPSARSRIGCAVERVARAAEPLGV
jgi:hypothetical protein